MPHRRSLIELEMKDRRWEAFKTARKISTNFVYGKAFEDYLRGETVSQTKREDVIEYTVNTMRAQHPDMPFIPGAVRAVRDGLVLASSRFDGAWQ